MSKPRKEKTVKEAKDQAEAAAKRKDDLKELILQEAYALESGEEHSIQQLLAYVRQLKSGQKPKSEK